jgi:hypothetical protein
MEKSTVYFTDFRCPVGTSQLDKLKKICIATTTISKIPTRISSGKQRWIRQRRLALEQENTN